MPSPEELQGDKDFMSANPADQIKYLSSTDPDFKNAHPDDQAAYLAHVTKQPTGAEASQPKPGVLGALDTAKDYYENKLEPVDKAVTKALAPNYGANTVVQQTKETPKDIARIAYGTGKTALGAIAGLPSAVGHAFSDEATPEEKAQQAGFEQEHGEKPGTETSGMKRIGLGVGRLTGINDAQGAVKDWSNPETRPSLDTSLELAEPAVEQGAGTVLGMEAAGKIAGIPSRKTMPTTTGAIDAGIRGAGRAYQSVLDKAPEAGAVIGGTIGAVHGPGAAAYGTYTGGRVGKILQKVLPEGNALTEHGLSVEDRNVQRFEKASKVADKAAAKAEDDHSVYAASEAHGPIDPEANPAYKKSMDALNKARIAQQEAHYHLQEAKAAAEEAKANAGAVEGQAREITPEEAALARPDQPTPTDADLKTRQEKLMADMEAKAGVEKPTPTPQNVKGPGQVQPETFPQEPTERPVVPPSSEMRPLAGNQGTVGGRKLALPGVPERPQLTEGIPEAPVNELPSSGKTIRLGSGEVLPPEAPKTKLGRIGKLKAEGGKIVDTEDPLQSAIEQGLQGTAKPVALKPLAAEAPKTPLGAIEPKLPTNYDPAKDQVGVREKMAYDDAIEARGKAEDEAKAKKEQLTAPHEKELKNPDYTPEHETKAEQVLSQHSDQDLIRYARQAGIDTDGYDFAKRDANRHRVERDRLVKDLLDKLPVEDKTNLARLLDEFNSKDTTLWTEAERSNLSKAQRSRAIMQEHEGGPKPISGGSQGADEPKGVHKSGEAESDLEMMRRGVDVGSEEKGNKAPNLAKAADDYNKSIRLPEVKPEKLEVSPRAKEIGQAYDDMKHTPNDPATKKSYAALVDDTKKQWDYLQNELGIKIEPTDEDPYKSHEEMMDDLKNNKRLKVYRGGEPLPEDHPLNKVDPETGEKYNTMFRAVHDAFGHGAQGHDFSEAGEESAWNTHRQMMSPEAIPAMTTETRAQVASFFKNDNKFPEQKAGILPDFAMERGDGTEHAEKIAKLTNEGGGATYNPTKGDMGGTDAYAVPMHPELSKTIEGTKVTPEQIQKFMDTPAVKKAMDADPTLSVGTWANDGKTYLDLSSTIPDRDEAIALGKKNGQKAITYLKDRTDIDLGGKGTGTPLEEKSPQSSEAAAGKTYAPKHSSGEWTEYPNDKAESDEEMARRGADVPEEKLKPSADNLKLSDEELLKKGYTQEDLDNGKHLPTVSGGAPSKKMPTGEELIKKYGESEGDPSHTAFILPDGRGVAQTGTIHDEMLGGKATDDVPRRQQFIEDGNIRMRARSGAGGREFAISIPESGITTEQLAHLKKMAPQMGSGTVTLEVGKPGGDYRQIEYGKASSNLEKSIREIAPIKNAKGSPVDEFGNPTVSGGSQGAGKLPSLAEKHLLPEEKNGVSKSQQSFDRFVENMKKAVPELKEYTDAAIAGAGERKWYQRSTQAFDAMSKEVPNYFDQEGDRDKFIGLLASGSPQQSVAMNMREALRVWTSYVDAGRPEGAALVKLLSKPSDKGGFTLPGAKIPNAMKALAGEEMWPDITKNSNFKVPSFRDNLTGVLNRVTNDGWMALFSGMDAKAIESAHSYHPISVMTRAAADELGWEPAEAQAAVWAFIKTLTEKGQDAAMDPHQMRQYSEDFSDIILHDPETRALLKDMGIDHGKLDERLRKEVEAKPEPDSSGGRPSAENSTRSAIKRVEAARGKGSIPAPKTGPLNFGEPENEGAGSDEATSFNTKDLETGKGDVKVTPLSERPNKTILSVKVDGERAGQMSLTPTPDLAPDSMEVSTSQLGEAYRGKGHGSEMYRQAVDYARSKGVKTLYSDDQVSTKADNVWQSLVRKGEAKWDSSVGRYKISVTALGRIKT
jgi:predicted GNAT family acetyltransferase